jgi:uncharacterized protein YutD
MKRIQFVVDDGVYNALEDLRKATEAKSLAEVFRNALKAYEWMVGEISNGREIKSVQPANEDGKTYSGITGRAN